MGAVIGKQRKKGEFTAACLNPVSGLGSTPGLRDTVKDRVLASQLLCRLISACLDVVHIACAKFSVHGEYPMSTF